MRILIFVPESMTKGLKDYMETASETALDELAWPAFRLGEAMEVLARKSGLIDRPASTPTFSENRDIPDERTAGQWIAFGADHLSIEAEPVASVYPEVEAMVQKAGPALVRLPGEKSPGFLAILKGRRRISVIAPDLSIIKIST